MIPGLSLSERDPRRIAAAIRQMQQGRSNAHGSFSLDTTPATQTVVQATTCGAGSHVSITPTNEAAKDALGQGVYVLAGSGQFTVTHSTTGADCVFTFGIIG